MFIGMDIGGTKIATLVTDRNGNKVATLTVPTRTDQLEASIIKAIYCVLESADLDPSHLLGIGLGIPGMVDHINGDVTHAVNLGITQPLPLAQILSRQFNTAVQIENDVRLAAQGVRDHLGIDNLVYLSLGTGFASGVIINGQLYRGQSGMAGEIGHVPVDADGRTLEQLIAGKGIVHQAIQQNIYVEHAGELFDLAEQGHPAAIKLVEHVSFYLARAIHWLVMAYDIDTIVLGGGVMRSAETLMPALYKTLADIRAQSDLYNTMLPDEKIVTLSTDFNAGQWGAIQMMRSLLPIDISEVVTV